MANSRLTRRRLLAAAAPLAAAPVLAKYGLDGTAAGSRPPSTQAALRAGTRAASAPAMGHAAMIGEGAPAVGGPHDLDSLLYPPPALPYEPGRVREYTLTATRPGDRDRPRRLLPGLDVQRHRPGPVLRATEGDMLRVRFVERRLASRTRSTSTASTRRTWTASSRSSRPADEFTYEFEARPAALQLYHCHSTPLKKHIHKGLYGALIIDPKEPRPPAQELVMVMNGYDTDGDGGNNFYTVNGRTFYYARYPITVKRSQLVRIYLANLTEFDLINSLHLHADFFRYYPTGSGDQFEYTDTVMQCQGQRGIIEIEFANTGTFMFHAHQSEFTELGWMGFFNVID